MTPLISIIIPCYNHGLFLDDAINSVRRTGFEDIFEIIVINDGSTDAYTLQKLAAFAANGITVLDQPNQGLAHARNNGIMHSSGQYILPLDADNKIRPEVFIKAAEILQADPDITVVYTDVQYFGDKTHQRSVGEFNIHQLIDWNYIDACSLISKKAIVRAGFYDPVMPAMVHEDWDLWITIASQAGKFYYLQEVGYDYRVVSDSMSFITTGPGTLQNKEYLFRKHASYIGVCYTRLLEQYNEEVSTSKKISKYIHANRIKTCARLITGKTILPSQ